MDRVRFGRVLGRGARLAARTMYEAVDAATTPAPSGGAVHANSVHANPAPSARQPSRAVQPAPQVRTRAAAPSQSARPRSGIFTPVKRASRAVSLEITGSFFALFALSFVVGAWHARGAISAGGPALIRLVLYCAVAVLFSYFSCSNFVKARRLA